MLTEMCKFANAIKLKRVRLHGLTFRLRFIRLVFSFSTANIVIGDEKTKNYE
jgi:hypothetical protein